MDTGNFSYLCPDLFGIFRNSHRLQCTHCARCDFQNLLKNIRLYDPKNLDLWVKTGAEKAQKS